MSLAEQPSAGATTLGEMTMAIGSVILSVQIAFFGSVYVSVVRDIAFLEGLALYSALGCLVLTATLIAAALVPNDVGH